MPQRRTVGKLVSFSSWFGPFEFASHFYGFGNVFLLRGFRTASQQNVDGRSRPRVINPISRSHMNTHFGNTFTHGSAIAEIPEWRAGHARQYPGLGLLVG